MIRTFLLVLTGAVLFCLFKAFRVDPDNPPWVAGVTGFGILLAALVALYKDELIAAAKAPRIDITYEGTALRFKEREWIAFLTVTNSGRSSLKNAMVRCLDVNPNKYNNLEMFGRFITNPLRWSYWDVDKNKPRNILSHESCDLLYIKESEQGTYVSLAMALKPYGQDIYLKPKTTYTIEVGIEADNYYSPKTWKFRIEWLGGFPTDYGHMNECISIEEA
jgi:hypothetical protein